MNPRPAPGASQQLLPPVKVSRAHWASLLPGVPPRPTKPVPVHRLVMWEHVKIVSGSPGNHRSRRKPAWTVSESLRVEGGRRALSVGVQCGPGRTHPSCPSSQGFLGTTRSDAQREEMHKGAAPLPRLPPQSVPTQLPRPCPLGHWGPPPNPVQALTLKAASRKPVLLPEA